VLVLGLTFKENCPDLRNTRVVDILAELRDYSIDVDVYDPQADTDEAQAEYGIALLERPAPERYDAIVLAVAHREFRELGAAGIRQWGKEQHVLYDLKYVLPKGEVDLRL
jgi:UDP-N-acetyl-D-galactosamine dehydrogenase